MAVASVRSTVLLAQGNMAALSTAVDLTTIAVAADEKESLTSLMTTDCLAEDGVGVLLHKGPRIVDIRDRRWQNPSIVFCASETELQSVTPVVDAAGVMYFSASADHIREKSGMKMAL
ncbi:MAG: hypothetical protein ACK496_00680 [Acidobacteriota bacterium]